MNDVKFAEWTLNAIREDGIMMGWLEERRYEWCPLAYRFVSSLIGGYSIVISTDSRRRWFGEYALQTINVNNGRPLVPIFSIDKILSDGHERNTSLVADMLNIAFGEKYIIWHIGHLGSRGAKLTMEHNHSFIWSIDGGMSHTFDFNSSDSNLDIKLLGLFKILDKTINAIMFNEI